MTQTAMTAAMEHAQRALAARTGGINAERTIDDYAEADNQVDAPYTGDNGIVRAENDASFYGLTEYRRMVEQAVHGILMLMDDSDLTYGDGRGNVVQVQLLDTLMATCTKQIEFHERIGEQDATRAARHLSSYNAGTEIGIEQTWAWEEKLNRHEKALAIYDALKAVVEPLYLQISGNAAWVPFSERGKAAPTKDPLVNAQRAEFTKRFGRFIKTEPDAAPDTK